VHRLPDELGDSGAAETRRAGKGVSTAPCAGFTYLWLLFFVAALGVGLSSVAVMWHTIAVRDKEQELLFVGNQFRRAIAAYYTNNLNVADRYPKKLEDLLQDPNQPVTRRYLRRIYLDPLSDKAEWGLVKSPAGGIMGVYSMAQATPVKIAAFPPGDESFEGAQRYSDWRFVVAPAAAAPTPPAGVGSGPVVVAAQSPGAIEQPPVPNFTPPPPQPRCDTVAQRDAVVCEAQLRRWGDARACYQSAAMRASACAAGAAVLPELLVRN
jgi:hypothetical protein